MSAIDTQRTVGELVAQRPARAIVFEKYGIDYCCGGGKPLAQACQERGVDFEAVTKELRNSDAAPQPPQRDWTKASLTELADHIVSTHHAFLREQLPRLDQLTAKVASVHGEHRPELRTLREVFVGFRQELESHMYKEEQILFPMCRTLEQSDSSAPPAFHCGSIANPIRVMIMEHDHAGDALGQMRTLTAGYRVPAEACGSYRAMLDGLESLEKDMHQHVHKENNILFPRAAQAEAELVQSCQHQ
jgi:regulator of cell morphogenesis and NO signaling